MKNLIIITLFLFSVGYSQKKKDFFVGFEIGSNKIKSFTNGEKQNFFQFGIVSEYVFSKKWSLNTRLKYYKTGVSFSKSNNDWSIFPGTTSSVGFNSFSGEILSLPITINWNYKFIFGSKGYLKTGLAANYEIVSKYNFSNIITDNDKFYGNFILGFGFQKEISDKIIVYVDNEIYRLGSHKGSTDGIVFSKNYYTTNNHLNFGFKYKL